MQIIKEVYDLYDKRGNGEIAVKDIGDVVRSLGYNPTFADINRAVNDLEGMITFEKFCPLLTSLINAEKPLFFGYNENFEKKFLYLKFFLETSYLSSNIPMASVFLTKEKQV